MTYRVVQVAPQDGSDPQTQVVTTAGFPAGAQVIPVLFLLCAVDSRIGFINVSLMEKG